MPRHNQKCQEELEKRDEDEREVPVRTKSISGPGDQKNRRDKPEVPGRFQKCEQGVHVVVPLALQFARFRFLEEEVNNIKVRFLPSCFKEKSRKINIFVSQKNTFVIPTFLPIVFNELSLNF